MISQFLLNTVQTSNFIQKRVYVTLSLIVRCHAYAWQRNMYLLKIGFSPIAPDPDNILQVYVGRTQIYVLKFWCPGQKGRKTAAKKLGVFCNWYSEVVFL